MEKSIFKTIREITKVFQISLLFFVLLRDVETKINFSEKLFSIFYRPGTNSIEYFGIILDFSDFFNPIKKH